jgi:hypothetical protein
MTWLGKILTFLVLFGNVVWAYFTVQTYVLRTNWKAETERVKKDRDTAIAALVAEKTRHLADEDALKRLYANEQKRAEDLNKQVDELAKANQKATEGTSTLQEVIDKGDVENIKLQANLDSSQKELDTVRTRNTNLENRMVSLIVDREEARREMVRAQNAAKIAQGLAEDNAKKAEDLLQRYTDLRAQGGGSGGTSIVRTFEKPPPPVLANLRGVVDRVAGDLVQLNIGVDAGLSKGTVLEIYRSTGGGQYLGRVKIVDLYPKQAVAIFTPARSNVPFDQLRPEELPKKDDEVRPTDR